MNIRIEFDRQNTNDVLHLLPRYAQWLHDPKRHPGENLSVRRDEHGAQTGTLIAVIYIDP